MFDSSLRLMPMISAENEWRYLINETFIGEKCIIPLLQQVLNSDIISNTDLKQEIERQLTEEINHVRIYYRYVGQDKSAGSEYDKHLFNLVSDLKSPTLKLFALQGMLEGIALGALEFRLKYWDQAPSTNCDRQVKLDEVGHTTLSYPFFSQLIMAEGPISIEQFKNVAKSVNQIFVNCFLGSVLKQYVATTGTVTNWQELEFEKTMAMTLFRRQSAQVISQNRSQFLDHYFRAAACV